MSRLLTPPGHLPRLVSIVAIALSLLTILSPAAGQARVADQLPVAPSDPAAPQAAGEGLELVSQLSLPGGTNGDIAVLKTTAYIGTWRSPCSGAGVKAVDVSDPARPRQIASLAAYAGSSAEDLIAISASTAAFRGDLLAVGLQACERGGPVGVDFWDVSDPGQPRQLSFLATPNTNGVHELHLFQRGSRIFALLAVPYSESTAGVGDFRIVEATDPSRPVELAAWGAQIDLGVSVREARGTFRAIYGHSANVSPDGNIAYVSYWDAGTILIDISDPVRPRYLSRLTYAGWEQGDTHSAQSQDGRLLAVSDELLSPPWGRLRLYDIGDLANPVELATWDTPHRRGEWDETGPPRGGSWYSAHNSIIRGNRLYVSWFGDGVRLLDISNPADPQEIAAYVPPRAPNVWGVAVQNDLIYLSDMNTGLYIVRHVGAPTARPAASAPAVARPAPPQPAAPAPPAPGARDQVGPGGAFFDQASPQAGFGFRVTDEAGIRFWSEFQRLGGVQGVGYPISSRFEWDGFPSQAFQKMVFQWHADEGRVYAVNVIDLIHDRGLDTWLRNVRSTPGIADWASDRGKPWPEVVSAHQALLTDPDIRTAYVAVDDPVSVYGLPMAPVQDMGNVLVLRAQRGILQKWLVDVPWAKAGQVTVANSGDVAKEAGLLPPDALIPRRP